MDNLPQQFQAAPVPNLAELHKSAAEAFKNDQLNYLLNQPPHNDWIKKHPMVKTKDAQGKSVPASYLPIDKVEYLLTRIFQQWRVEVLNATTMFQSIAVTIRLHYLNPVTNEWSFHDGVGAKSVQVNAGQSAADLSQIKDAAVMMALPAAKSYAIKDAAEHLGTLFGKDLNRVDTLSFRPAFDAPPDEQQEQQEQPSQPQQAPPPVIQPAPTFKAPEPPAPKQEQPVQRAIPVPQPTPILTAEQPKPITNQNYNYEL